MSEEVMMNFVANKEESEKDLDEKSALICKGHPTKEKSFSAKQCLE